MVRFTKQGQLDGETNLDLPPLTERSVEARILLWLGSAALPCLPPWKHSQPRLAEPPLEGVRHPPLIGCPPSSLGPCELQCELTAQDEEMYRTLRVQQRQAFHTMLARHNVDPNCVGGGPLGGEARGGQSGGEACALPAVFCIRGCTRGRGWDMLPLAQASVPPPPPYCLSSRGPDLGRERQGGQGGQADSQAARHAHQAAPGGLQCAPCPA